MNVTARAFFLFLALLIFLLSGCVDDVGMPSIPYTTSQFINRSTDLNYLKFVAGDYNGKILYLDVNKLSARDVNQVIVIASPIDTNTQTAGWTNSSGAYLVDLNMGGKNIKDVNKINTKYVDVNGTFYSIGTMDANGSVLRGIRSLTPATPSVALAGLGAGDLNNGTYYYIVTYYNSIGESLKSAEASLTVVDKTVNGRATVTIPISPYPDTIGRKIYRTVTIAPYNDNTYYLLTTIANNTTTTYTDNIPESSLRNTNMKSLAPTISRSISNYRSYESDSVAFGYSNKYPMKINSNGDILFYKSDGNITAIFDYALGRFVMSSSTWAGLNTAGGNSGNGSFYSDTDVSNTNTQALYITPGSATQRLHIGTSTTSLYSVNWQYVNSFESFPPTVNMQSTQNSYCYAGAPCSVLTAQYGANRDLILYSGSGGGRLKGNGATVMGHRQIAWSSDFNNDDTYQSFQGIYSYDTRFGASATNKKNHTEWMLAGSRLMALGVDGNLYIKGQTRIDTNLGIGTTSAPTYRLEVKGFTANDAVSSDIGYNINPVTKPTTFSGVVTAGGGLGNGNYYYAISYMTDLGETGTYRNYIAYTTTPGNNSVTLTIPTSTDPRVTKRRLYRTVVGGGALKYLDIVNNNTATTYVDTLSDGNLTGWEVAGSGPGQWRMNTTSNGITVSGTKSLVIDAVGTYVGFNAGTNAYNASCTFIGANAGTNAGQAEAGTFVGTSAGTNATGAYGTFIGAGSGGGASVTGSSNTGVGAYSFQRLISGATNVAIGAYATPYLTTGSNNTGVGYGVMSGLVAGSSNTAVGRNALNGDINGGGNTAIGRDAGSFLADGTTPRASGDNGLYLGYNTKSDSNGTTNENVLGYNAIGNGSNTFTFGNSSITKHLFPYGNLGIGTTTPATTLDVNGTARFVGDVNFDGNVWFNDTYWTDIYTPIISAKLAGVNDPDYSTFSGNTKTYEFQDNVLALQDEVYLTFQMPHTYKLNSAFEPHLHWTPDSANTGNSRFEMDCVKSDINATFSGVSFRFDLNATSDFSNAHRISDANATTSCSNISCIIQCHLYRASADALDTYSAGTFIHALDWHIEQDAIGSRTEYGK